MVRGLSVEVFIPAGVTADALINIGLRCAPADWEHRMTADDALQFAFNNPVGPALLAALGITWQTITSGC